MQIISLCTNVVYGEQTLYFSWYFKSNPVFDTTLEQDGFASRTFLTDSIAINAIIINRNIVL